MLWVVGIEASGHLAPRSLDLVLGAEVLLGGPRHLALVPPVDGQARVPWPSPLLSGLRDLLARCEDRRVVALASGDPLVSGIGGTLARLGVPFACEPAVSSVALARARMGWPAESHAVVSLVGRDPALVLREVAPGRRILVLSPDETTPGVVADLLDVVGAGGSRLTVLGDLGSAGETRIAGTASDHWPADLPRLHVLAIDVAPGVVTSWAPGLPDDDFEHDGQLTKRDVRASALARLAPAPGQLLWDIGAGAGSVGIEWARTHPTCRTTAVEASRERVSRIERNASRLGVPTLRVVHGRAPEALTGLPAPDAVFVGGGATAPGLLAACRSALRPGGRLVVHGVTLETETVLAAAYASYGGELVRLSVETAAPIGSFTGWTPARAVTQWTWRA